MTQFCLFRPPKGGYLSFLPNEILYILLDQLDDKDQYHLSLTCKKFYRLVRLNLFGIVTPVWKDAEVIGLENLSASCYRDGVVVNNSLFIPILEKKEPYCLSINLVQKPLKLIRHSILIDFNTKSFYEPCEFIATAAIGNRLYIFGGKNLNSGEITNAFYELNINTFELKKLHQSHHLPKPRMMHTLNSIDNHRLALFGGRMCMNGKYYDSKDFAIYDVKKNSWEVINNESAFVPSRRSNQSTMFFNDKLYIYGGQQITSSSTLNRIHDDPDIWEYDTLKLNWKRYLNGLTLSGLLLPKNCISTSGVNPSKRCGAAIFPIRKNIGILGGIEMMQINEEILTWGHMKILSPMKQTWVQVKVKEMPRIECVAFYVEYKFGTKDIFVIGKDQKEGKIITGWIKDEQ
ncbi:unnamed protein product [Rhizophagus irregularis]|nr:unnamed protein product [Rhizophagus irregularis]CAB5374241.1 unnamed protein product [Rhizophagus irregularis]